MHILWDQPMQSKMYVDKDEKGWEHVMIGWESLFVLI